MGLQSPLAFVPLESLLSSHVDIVYGDGTPDEREKSSVVQRTQRRVNPPPPEWKIPRSQWPDVLHRVNQGESLRQVAKSYGVSYEAVRRVLRAARREGMSG
jgi:hypothetical protein